MLAGGRFRLRNDDQTDSSISADSDRKFTEFISFALVNRAAVHQQHCPIAVAKAENRLPKALGEFARMSGLAEALDLDSDRPDAVASQHNVEAIAGAEDSYIWAIGRSAELVPPLDRPI